MDNNIPNLGTISQVLNAAALRQRVIAQNVANVNTPGYRRLEVAFQNDLTRAVSATSVSALPKVVIADGPERVDGNTVDIDKEMNDLTKNALLYQAATQILSSRIAMTRAAIAGR